MEYSIYLRASECGAPSVTAVHICVASTLTTRVRASSPKTVSKSLCISSERLTFHHCSAPLLL